MNTTFPTPTKLIGASKAVQVEVGNSFAVVSAVQISTSKSSSSTSSELTTTWVSV